MTENKECSWKIRNICGSGDYSVCCHFDDFSNHGSNYKNIEVIKCKKCGVRRRKPEAIDEYEEDYHSYYLSQKGQVHPHTLSIFSDLMMERLRDFGKLARFLDVRCSTGRALSLARSVGFDCVGFDVSKCSVDNAIKMGFEAKYGLDVANAFEDKSFHIIHCSYVIEHVSNPMLFLERLHSFLRPNGILMLACPNYASLPRLVKGKAWGLWCLDSHLWQFTKNQMVRLLKERNYRVAKVRTLHGQSPDSNFKRLILDIAALLGYGDGLNIIARKI